ncbi:D-Ala-D-Ala carboxypeptidase family metallohydrolase [Parvibaculum sp. MBR-TMA-1.3b-4.2]|jgi:hypothetical protein
MKLSPHFTLAEAMRSQYAARHGIDNTPPDEVLPALRHVAAHVLEPVRAHYGIPFSPNSWYRCPLLNAGIGGATHSRHVLGEAVDIELPGVSNFDLAHWCAANLDFDQVILECWDGYTPTSGWVHVGAKAEGNRHEILTYSHGRYTKGLP